MRIRSLVVVAAAASLFSACSEKDLNIINPNAVTPLGAAADPAFIQLSATGLLSDFRANTTAFPQPVGILGRESFTFTPTEGRNTTTYIVGIVSNGVQKIDAAAGFAGSTAWAGPYGTLRDVFNFKASVAASTALTAAQKSAATGFAQTIEAFALLQVIATHDTLGAITEIKENATDLAPFVSRDSVYKYILNTLDAAFTSLQAGGAAFPFTLHSGFTSNGTFNTPAGFAQFNRGLRARAGAYYATAGGGAAAWQGVITALGNSFLNAGATTRAQLDAGVYQIFSTATGDALNGLTLATSTTLYAHPSLTTEAQLKADGTKDNRYLLKIKEGLPAREGPRTADGPTSASSTTGPNLYLTSTTPMAVMRNEELILLRAEARLATGDKAGAIADLNQVRINSGGLPASTLTTASSDDAILTGILYEKRFSLYLEGHRWIDARRYNKLGTVPLDVNAGPNKNFVAKVIPVPQAECLVRAKATGDLLGPNGQNNCAQ